MTISECFASLLDMAIKNGYNAGIYHFLTDPALFDFLPNTSFVVIKDVPTALQNKKKYQQVKNTTVHIKTIVNNPKSDISFGEGVLGDYATNFFYYRSLKCFEYPEDGFNQFCTELVSAERLEKMAKTNLKKMINVGNKNDF